MTGPKRFFAVGLKDWIQVRECSKPPKTHITSVQVPYTEERWEYFDGDVGGVYVPPKRKIITLHRKLKNTVHLGGREILTIKRRKFSAITGFSIVNGKMAEIPPYLIPGLLENAK